jgi:hypothetical protein
MSGRYVSRRESMGVPRWIRGFCVLILVAAFMFTTATARAQDSEKVANAEAAALGWLALTDAGDDSHSWDQAASIFQASVSKKNG